MKLTRHRVTLLLGSNIEPEHNLLKAIRFLAQTCRIVAVSPVYETLPMGLRQQPNFLNAAVLVETELEPASLKESVLTPLEQALHRVRTDNKNAPRTIDADIVLYDDRVTASEGRHIPDPDLVKFPHVAVPVADVNPEMSHPETGERLRDLAQRLTRSQAQETADQPILWRRPDMDARLAEAVESARV